VQRASFRARVLAMLSGAGLAPGRLLVELTETAEITDIDAAMTTLGVLRNDGVPVCLDDLGARPAAFRYLRHFRFDFVKIDGAYVRGAGTQDRNRRPLGAMIDLVHGLGARVIAEMVETEADAAALRSLGAEFGQGWLFGRPLLLQGPAGFARPEPAPAEALIAR